MLYIPLKPLIIHYSRENSYVNSKGRTLCKRDCHSSHISFAIRWKQWYRLKHTFRSDCAYSSSMSRNSTKAAIQARTHAESEPNAHPMVLERPSIAQELLIIYVMLYNERDSLARVQNFCGFLPLPLAEFHVWTAVYRHASSKNISLMSCRAIPAALASCACQHCICREAGNAAACTQETRPEAQGYLSFSE